MKLIASELLGVDALWWAQPGGDLERHLTRRLRLQTHRTPPTSGTCLPTDCSTTSRFAEELTDGGADQEELDDARRLMNLQAFAKRFAIAASAAEVIKAR